MKSEPSRSRIVRIAIVDDHAIVRSGLTQLLTSVPEFVVCGEAADRSSALTIFREVNPDLGIIDITLPDCNGLQLMQELLKLYPKSKMLMVSMHDEALYAERALSGGAMGYLSKRAASEEIIVAIRKIMYEGETYTSNVTVLDDSGDETNPGRALTAIASLSDRELQIFEFLGRGMKPSEISDLLNRSVKTVNKHIENIKLKFQIKTIHELTRRAIAHTSDLQQ